MLGDASATDTEMRAERIATISGRRPDAASSFSIQLPCFPRQGAGDERPFSTLGRSNPVALGAECMDSQSGRFTHYVSPQ